MITWFEDIFLQARLVKNFVINDARLLEMSTNAYTYYNLLKLSKI